MTKIAYAAELPARPGGPTAVSVPGLVGGFVAPEQDSDYAAAARILARRLAELSVMRQTGSGGRTGIGQAGGGRTGTEWSGHSSVSLEPIWSGDDIDPIRSTAQQPVLTYGQLDDGLLTGRAGIAVALAAASQLPGGQSAWLTLARSAAAAAVQSALDESALDPASLDRSALDSVSAPKFAGLGWCSGWLGIARGAQLVAAATRAAASTLSSQHPSTAPSHILALPPSWRPDSTEAGEDPLAESRGLSFRASRPDKGRGSEDPLTVSARELAGRAIAALAADPMLAPDYPDLLDGLAGHLCAVLAAEIPAELEPARLTAATALLNRLLSWAQPAGAGSGPVSWPMCGIDPPVIGLAHGGSGISMALTAAARAKLPTAVELTSLITRTRQWEDSHFQEAAGGWPDLRAGADVPGLAWCHGAPGIGLAAAYRQLVADPTPGPGADFCRASTMIRQFVVGAAGPASGSTPFDGTWCHGLGGIVEMHLLAAEAWPTAAAEHLTSARLVAQNWTRAGQPGHPAWTCGVRGGRTPNLLTGIAGVTYSLTRCHNPTLGPSLAHPGLPQIDFASTWPRPGTG